MCFISGECRERSYQNRESWFEPYRQVILDKARKLSHAVLPSPHSELVLGMVIGVDDFHLLPKFKEALISTGVIHVVVVSGYNINIVFSVLSRMVGSMTGSKTDPVRWNPPRIAYTLSTPDNFFE